jgi:ribonuclease BN (tRNA processing enzyme)
VRLTVVGCAGSFPSAQSPASCYLVEHDGHRVLLDLGNGSLGALQQHVDLVWPGALDAVLLSHCHIDHCADLGSLYVQRHYGPHPATEPLLVLGPSDARARAVAMYGKSDEAGLDHQFDYVTFPRAAMTVGPFTIETVRVAHPVESYAMRVTAGGRSLTYSGDTGPTPRLVELARGTDVALFEASFVGDENPPGVHLSGADAARAAAESGAGMLLLTHHVAWNDPAVVRSEAAAHFGGPLEQAAPGLTISL